MGTMTPLPPAPSRAAPATFSTLADALLGALDGFVSEANALESEFESAVASPAWSGTSTTSLAIGTGSKTLTIQTGKSINVGMSVKIAYTTTATNWMFGDVTAYNSGTGALTVNVTQTNGSGTYTAWTVTMSGPVGPEMLKVAAADTDFIPLAYMIWVDTTAGLLKQRNAANNAWLTLGSAVTAFMGLLSLATGQTITAQHTIAPGSDQAPFVLGAHAQGQLVTGLDADKLDGNHFTDLQATFAALAGLSTQAFSAADGTTSKQVVNISQFVVTLSTQYSVKFPGGAICKMGLSSGSNPETITFDLAFPTEIKTVNGTIRSDSSGAISDESIRVYDESTAGFTYRVIGGARAIFWTAWGK